MRTPWNPCGPAPSGPTGEPGKYAYQRWLQMASVPCAPPPVSSPTPAWIDWKWSM